MRGDKSSQWYRPCPQGAYDVFKLLFINENKYEKIGNNTKYFESFFIYRDTINLLLLGLLLLIVVKLHDTLCEVRVTKCDYKTELLA